MPKFKAIELARANADILTQNSLDFRASAMPLQETPALGTSGQSASAVAGRKVP